MTEPTETPDTSGTDATGEEGADTEAPLTTDDEAQKSESIVNPETS